MTFIPTFFPVVALLGAFQAPGVIASNKRGIGWSIHEQELGPIKPFFEGDSKIKWWYDWNKCWDCKDGDSFFSKDRKDVGDVGKANGAEFIPQVWTDKTLDEKSRFQPGYTTVMGFNEPDRAEDDGRSNPVDPNKAAEEWKRMIKKIKKKRPNDFKSGKTKFVSPAPASDLGWLVTFFNALCGDNSSNQWKTCSYDHPPDYVGVHAYETTVDAMKGKVESYHSTFAKPIVLSEFACKNFGEPSAPDIGVVKEFMTTSIAWLEQTDYIVRYAWLGSARAEDGLGGVGDSNRLMKQDGSLTELGKMYRDLPASGGKGKRDVVRSRWFRE